MKKLLFYLTFLFCGLFVSPAAAQEQVVTLEDALSIAQRQFEGQDVDYFWLQYGYKSVWTILVDAEPMKGWEHDAYVLVLPKKISGSIESAEPTSITKHTSPPPGDWAPLDVKNRYGVSASIKPIVAKHTNTNGGSPAASRTYAIILSGGGNKTMNYERYWNDCSFIYQTLVNRYGVPKDHIYPIMSDGDNPAEDMRLNSPARYQSQPLDLDFDGENDISLAATKANIQSVISSLNPILTKDDHLFIYVIDHGGLDEDDESYICLWNGEKLFPSEMNNMLQTLRSKLVNTNVVMGQCYSGGFVDSLKSIGCVVATACAADEPSYSCIDYLPFDEFVYHWTCAINGANHMNVAVESDLDCNGRVTMLEAFQYAMSHDRCFEDEHPQYYSNPISIGEDLAFNHIPAGVDLYIRDNLEDTGKEPNRTTEEFWKSPSIWIRNQHDSIYEHENPIYTDDHQMAHIYVRVENRGKEDFLGGGKWVMVYWSQASTAVTAKTWKGRELYDGKYATGGVLEAAPIGAIPAGGFSDIHVRWALPNLLENYPDGNFHFCLFAKIMDTSYDDGYVEGQFYFNQIGKNDHAQKNVTIIKGTDLKKSFNVYVRNVESTVKNYSLELIPRTAASEAAYNKADIKMKMSPKIYNAWQRGGLTSNDIEIINSSDREIKFASPKSKLQKISLAGNEFDRVELSFNFRIYPLLSTEYIFDLVQKDEEGNIIGGETFVLITPEIVLGPPTIINATSIGGTQYELDIEDPKDIDNVKWLDSENNIISTDLTATVMPSVSNHDYRVIAQLESGEVTSGSISLDNENGFESLAIVSNRMIINLRSEAPANAVISIMSMSDTPYMNTFAVAEGSKEVAIDLGASCKGIYLVTYSVGGETIDQSKILND